MKGLLRLIAVIAMLVALAAPARAADTGWTIDQFRSDITIRPDGSLAILESIDVDFSGLSKHGIFRDIPTRYQYDDTHDRLYRLAVQSVTDAAGRAVTYQVNDWGTGLSANVAITNTGTSTVNGWTLAFTWPGNQHVTQGWSATWSQTGNQVTATNLSWDASIAPSATVTIGFNASYSGSDPRPAGFTLNGAACTSK